MSAGKNKVRADELLVKRGLAETRSKAQALILSGVVFVKGPADKDWKKISKAGDFLKDEVEFDASRLGPKDVGRGAQKLREAFRSWPQMKADGALCLDVGSSTGGFTQVLLEKGASRVVALDVGTGQLHEKLRNDARVISIEQQHVLKVEPSMWARHGIEPSFRVIVTDLSFISLTKIIPTVAAWLAPQGFWIVLIKPQFELEPKKVPKGVVRDEEHRLEAIQKVRAVLKEQKALEWVGIVDSPILGGDGNKEYLACVRSNQL
jgi:23S rRNA (cytidine1920-2'-O)/16S rRNA (cytidine1409-2'-O)-methyltransferase